PDHAHDQICTVRDPTLEPAGPVGLAVEPTTVVVVDLVVDARSAAAAGRYRVADLHAPGRLDREHRAGQAAVQALAGRHVRAQPGRPPERPHLGDASQRVAVVLRSLDL